MTSLLGIPKSTRTDGNGRLFSSARGVRFLLAATAVATVISSIEYVHTQAMFAPRPRPLAAVPRVPAFIEISGDLIDSVSTDISDHDPFRLSHEPSDVPYAPEPAGNVAPLQSLPKPPITLSGVVGPPWVAVLEGVPGHDGDILAKRGDTVSRAPFALTTVKAIRSDAVLLTGTDTTWTLMVRHVWR